jgi:hypothetical protein
MSMRYRYFEKRCRTTKTHLEISQVATRRNKWCKILNYANHDIGHWNLCSDLIAVAQLCNFRTCATTKFLGWEGRSGQSQAELLIHPIKNLKYGGGAVKLIPKIINHLHTHLVCEYAGNDKESLSPRRCQLWLGPFDIRQKSYFMTTCQSKGKSGHRNSLKIQTKRNCKNDERVLSSKFTSVSWRPNRPRDQKDRFQRFFCRRMCGRWIDIGWP